MRLRVFAGRVPFGSGYGGIFARIDLKH